MDAKDFGDLLEKRLVKPKHRFYRSITPIDYLPQAIDEPFQKEPSDIVEITALNEYRFEYDQRKDILSAMRLFAECSRHNVYPPVEILLVITKGFEAFLKSDKTLDEAFKIAGPTRLKKKEKTDRNHAEIFTRIDRNRYFLGISVDDAVGMEVRRLEASGKDMTSDTLLDIYHRSGRKTQADNYNAQAHRVWRKLLPECVKEEILEQYPEEVRERIRKIMK